MAAFLHEHLNQRVSAQAWARAVRVPWRVDAPNHGFMLVDGDEPDGARLVGAYLAFYSTRVIDGQTERFCNLGAWCVLPEHRFGGLRLVKTMLAQEGYHFTDLSPSGSVVALNTRMGFSFLDTTTVLMPNLPWPTLPGGGSITSDPAVLERTLTGVDGQLYRDHADAAGARHLLLRRGEQWCYVIFRKDRRKNLPVFASLLYVSEPRLFAAMARRVSRHLLLRHGVLACLAEPRIVGSRPSPAVLLGTGRRKMYRSASLKADQIDDLYSELTCVAW